MTARSKIAAERKLLATAFSRHQPYQGHPLQFNVALNYVNFDWENLLGVIRDKDLVPEDLLSDQAGLDAVRQMHNAELLFEITQEEMIDRLKLDCYRMPSDSLAKKFAVAAGPFDAVFELLGRSGKHLCPVHFEGASTSRYTAKELLDAGLANDDFDLDWCRNLACMAAEWSLCFASDAVHDELHYLAAARIACEIDDTCVRPLRVRRVLTVADRRGKSRYHW